MSVAIKRVYEPATRSDGVRVLVDRLWPRGLSKEKASIDLWLQDAAPSSALRIWFDHDPARWKEFRTRYGRELRASSEALAPLLAWARTRTLTLLYSARDERHNQAVVLKAYLDRRTRAPRVKAPAMTPQAPARRTLQTVSHERLVAQRDIRGGRRRRLR